MEKFQNGDKLRISKFLASKNIGSRKDIEKFISERRISLNGMTVTTPITFVEAGDQIYLDNKLINTKLKFEILKYYKPIGFITSHKKQDKRPIIFENLPDKYKNYKTAGRLDYNSEGLLILSSDGEITQMVDAKFLCKAVISSSLKLNLTIFRIITNVITNDSHLSINT